MCRRSRTVASAPSRSALLTTKTSPISRMPALAAWMPSPMPGASSTTVVSASPATSTSDWPTPTVSTSTTSQPAASSTRSACGVVHDRPPRWPRDGHRADVDLGVEGVVLHADPVAEQRAAGERRATGRRRARRPAGPARGRRRRARSSSSTCRRPGLPVRPMTCALPACGASAAITSRSAGGRPRRARSAARRRAGDPPWPTRPGRGRRRSARHAVQAGGGQAVAGTRTMRASPWPPPPHRAAAPTPPPRRCSSSARCRAMRAPDMPIGWPRAMAPPLTLTLSTSMPSSLAEARPTAAKASLISTRSRSAGVMPSLLAGLRDGAGRLLLERRVGAGDHAVRADLGEPGQARAPRPSPCS